MATPKAQLAVRKNTLHARAIWGRQCSGLLAKNLRELTMHTGVSVALGDVILLDGRWYITHSGLLRLALTRGCKGIHVCPVSSFCDASLSRWAFRATVYKSRTCKGFVGYGDADPSNVSPLVRGAEMRVAETRAVNRALRKAYGIGICSVEELGARPEALARSTSKIPPQSTNGNGLSTQPRLLRDRLCQIIRQHQLDPVLVKSYAVEFCGTKTLKDASREQVENFINHLADWAAKDKNALLCQLNNYIPAGPRERAA